MMSYYAKLKDTMWSPSPARQHAWSHDSEYSGVDSEKGFLPGNPALSRGSLKEPLVSSPLGQHGYHNLGLLVLVALMLGSVCGALGTLTYSTWIPTLPSWTPRENVVDEQRRQLFKVLGRDVYVYKPAKAYQEENLRLPVVVALHGSVVHPLDIARVSHFEEVAELSQNPFLVVFPDMQKPGGMEWGYDKDLGFFRAVVDMLDREFTMKREEVYVCGHSAGGSMSLYLQNNLPDVFRAAAAVEAGVGHEELWNMSSRGKPVMLIENRNDPVLKYYKVYPQKNIKMLRRHDLTATGPSFRTKLPLLDHSAVRSANKTSWGAVGSTPPTLFIDWETYTATHLWPHPENVKGAFNAAEMIWEFFRSVEVFWANEHEQAWSQTEAENMMK